MGRFDEHDITRFAKQVMAGRGDIRKLPSGSVEPPDASAAQCQAILADILDLDDGGDGSSGGGGGNRGGGSDEDGADAGGDDDVAELLREAAAEREAAERAAAAEAAEKEKNRDECDDPNLNEWGQKECRTKLARQRELEEEKQRLVRPRGVGGVCVRALVMVTVGRTSTRPASTPHAFSRCCVAPHVGRRDPGQTQGSQEEQEEEQRGFEEEDRAMITYEPYYSGQ